MAAVLKELFYFCYFCRFPEWQTKTVHFEKSSVPLPLNPDFKGDWGPHTRQTSPSAASPCLGLMGCGDVVVAGRKGRPGVWALLVHTQCFALLIRRG